MKSGVASGQAATQESATEEAKDVPELAQEELQTHQPIDKRVPGFEDGNRL